MSRQRALDIAIVDKVESILKNADHVTKMHIGIFADADEIPAIRYSIEETIWAKGERGDYVDAVG